MEAQYFKKGDGAQSIKIRQLEEQNTQLKQALSSNQGDFKDLLKEID
jgi:hypothetical protein